MKMMKTVFILTAIVNVATMFSGIAGFFIGNYAFGVLMITLSCFTTSYLEGFQRRI